MWRRRWERYNIENARQRSTSNTQIFSFHMRSRLQGMGLLSMATALCLASCGNKPTGPQAPPPTAVNVYTVEAGNATYFDNYPATATPLNQVDIKPQVSGNIVGIFFKDGQRVRKGQKLYEIDQQQYKAAVEQAKAN